MAMYNYKTRVSMHTQTKTLADAEEKAYKKNYSWDKLKEARKRARASATAEEWVYQVPYEVLHDEQYFDIRDIIKESGVMNLEINDIDSRNIRKWKRYTDRVFNSLKEENERYNMYAKLNNERHSADIEREKNERYVFEHYVLGQK